MEKSTISAIDQFVIDKVREMRIELGYSQKELSSLLDMAISFVGNVESPNKRDKYNLTHLNKIAEVFACSPKDFLPEKFLKNKK